MTPHTQPQEGAPVILAREGAQALSGVPPLAPAERHQLLREWNDTDADYPAHLCLHELFERQVQRTPDAIAVVLPGGHAGQTPGTRPPTTHQDLTYRELNRRANQLARHLRGLGVGPDVRVAICMERSLEMIIGLLGILKAGGAYVPLDPAYPRKRLAFALDDVQAPVLLTQQGLSTKLPAQIARVICLDTDWGVVAGEAWDNLGHVAAPENLAYVIYTSGSTGTPKGVMIEHRSAVNYITAMGRNFELGPGDRALQFASMSFDAAVEEVFTTLTRGATLILRLDSMLASVAHFLQRCGEWGVTVLNLPTAYWHEVTVRLDPDALTVPSGIRLVIIGGEKALPDRLAEWRRRVSPQVRLINTYGPTETTITATVCDLAGSAAVEADLQGVPIGCPVPNVRAYVLDGQLQPVPLGTRGELYIGGVAVARGYLNRPELTAERFIPNPFSAEPGARLYRTGDLVCYRPDGNLQFHGRVDHQVKLRGFRIELGEIESALRRHAAVNEAVVVLREDRAHDPSLVAYVEARQPSAASPGALRTFLQEQLPEYMVPAAFVVLAALPRLPSGKVDPDALPAPQRTRDAAGVEYVSPGSATETRLCRLFAQLLGLDSVGAADGFFELGGHSLLAARLIAEVRDELGVDVSLLDVFERPTAAGLADIVEQRRGGGETTRKLPPVARAPRTSELPLSFSQEPIWFLRQLEPDNLAYNAQWCVRFTGHLDVAALERTLTEIVRRHEVLRTTFPARQGKPVQEIHSAFTIDLPVVDFSHLAPAERAALADQRVAEECRRPFDITRLPLVQWTLLRLTPTEHILVQVEQHFVHDGWSIAILLRELVALYEAFVRGRPSPLPEMSVQFADYAAWQRQWLQPAQLTELLAYWRRQLTGSPPLLALPTDRPRPRMQTFRGGLQARTLDPDLYEQLRAFGRREGLTPFMVMLAAFKALLTRYSGATDVVVATTVANRPAREFEDLIGMFVNTVVLRTDYSGDPDFRELTRRVRQTALTAYAHQELPFERLVAHLAPPRDSGYNPLFQVMFSFHDAPVPDLVLPELEGRVEYLHNGSSKVDINVVVIARREQRIGLQTDASREAVSLEFEYNSDLFDRETISRMLDRYEVLLASAIGNPARRLSQLEFLTEPERREVVTAWNDTAADYPRDRCLPDLIHANAQAYPEAPAVRCDGVTLTYAEVCRRVESWARHLRQVGAGPGTRVAVCVERSADMVVALLATMRTGAAYVPLDPTHPEQRLRYELEDAGVTIVVTQQAFRPRLPVGPFRTVCIDQPLELGSIAPADVVLPAVSPDSTAYVIYTSGSTGRPKGVQIAHRALVNCLSAVARRLAVGKADRCLAITTIAFDIAGLELYLPLMVGGQVEIVPSPVAEDGRLLARAVATGRPTLMQATPATWRMLLQSGWPGDPALRILCGGEALPTDLARALLPRCHALFNMYGPTETTIWSALHEVRPDDDPVPIGRPIDNTVIHILDANRNPLPVGIPGELYIGGDGLAQGYLGRPDLTAERFVSDPIDSASGRLLYRTGDLARRRVDGSVEYLGRVDSQIKLRGFRIELEEIEAVLREHPGVRDCAAAVREFSPDDRRLAAFVVPAADTIPDAGALKAFLAERLPDYMLPAAFVTVERLPLTASGKLDRKALPEVDFAQAVTPGDGAPPETPTEMSLAALWQAALGVERVGRYDNFFDLGGHSLLSMQLIARIEEEHGVWLSPRDFMLQNLSQLAAVCDARMSGAAVAARETDSLGGRILRRLRQAVWAHGD